MGITFKSIVRSVSRTAIDGNLGRRRFVTWSDSNQLFHIRTCATFRFSTLISTIFSRENNSLGEIEFSKSPSSSQISEVFRASTLRRRLHLKSCNTKPSYRRMKFLEIQCAENWMS
jgi:hypothetical protein